MNKAFQKAWNWAYGECQDLGGLLSVSWDKCVRSHLYRSPAVLSIQETLTYIVENKCSVSRFGDGEIKLVAGQSLAFQPYSRALQEGLESVLTCPVDNLLVCIPGIFGDMSYLIPDARKHWERHLARFRKDWIHYTSSGAVLFGNAFMTRCYQMMQDKQASTAYFRTLKQIWEYRDVLLVEGAESRLGVGNDLFDGVSSLRRILAPNADAFSLYDRILAEVESCASPSCLILIALGPTATILAFDLARKGYQALDIGHVDIEYEWFLMGAEHKMPVRGKHVNEAGGSPKDSIGDERYFSEIVCNITA